MDVQQLAEYRYRAVREVLVGSAIGEVAARYGTSRQTLHSWRRRFEQEGMPGLLDRSRRPRNSPTRLSAEVEAEICELRRRHPRWGARRISHELSGRGLEPTPSRATVHRVLSRNGLVRAQEQQHPRKYPRWQREVPMHLWQMDLAGKRQLLGPSPTTGDTAENSSDIPQSVQRSVRTIMSVEHADNQSASRTRRPHHPASPAVLEDLRKAGAAKAEGAPPLSQAQVDRIVAILRQAGSQTSARRGRGAPHRTAGGPQERYSAPAARGAVTLLSHSRSPNAAA
ncbi:helix-turn-helix domain-containing protein [Streptomyces albidoflavus]|uniref:helix-turn-helix domain-containing protein n=1 Tax=Streptomyces sp. B29(2018) TaxID=2485016 RepID=UPI000A992A6F|nr:MULTISPECIES: helix-turn-helix domain-containing protein [unclassified Streptomyces]